MKKLEENEIKLNENSDIKLNIDLSKISEVFENNNQKMVDIKNINPNDNILNNIEKLVKNNENNFKNIKKYIKNCKIDVEFDFNLLFNFLLKEFENEENSNIIKMNIIYVWDSFLMINNSKYIKKFLKSEILHYLYILCTNENFEEDNELLNFFYNENYFDNENNKKTYELLIQNFWSWYYKLQQNYPSFNEKFQSIKKKSEYLNNFLIKIEDANKLYENYLKKFEENLEELIDYFLKEIDYQNNNIIDKKLENFHYLNNIDLKKIIYSVNITNFNYNKIIEEFHNFINNLKLIKSQETMYDKIDYQFDILKNVINLINKNEYLNKKNFKNLELEQIFKNINKEKIWIEDNKINKNNIEINKIEKEDKNINNNVIIGDEPIFSNEEPIKSIIHISENKIKKKDINKNQKDKINEEELEYNEKIISEKIINISKKKKFKEYNMSEDEMISFYIKDIEKKKLIFNKLKLNFFSKINEKIEIEEEYINNLDNNNKLINILKNKYFSEKESENNVNLIIKDYIDNYEKILIKEEEYKNNNKKTFKNIKTLNFDTEKNQINLLKSEVINIKKDLNELENKSIKEKIKYNELINKLKQYN